MTDSYDLIVKLRAIREFKPDPLSDDDLGAILEAARWTGSSKNRQDWSFIVVTGDRLQGLAEHGDYTDPIRASAATIVLVKEDGGNLFDIGRAAQNIMLAAKTIGVASCPITLHRPRRRTALPRCPRCGRDALRRCSRLPDGGNGTESVRGTETGRGRGQIRALLTARIPGLTGSDHH